MEILTAAGKNGQFWGARARDWAEVQEGQFAAAYDAVLSHAGWARHPPSGRRLRGGHGRGTVASLGASVAGIDAAAEMLEIARERTPRATSGRATSRLCPSDDDAFDLVTGFNSFQFAGDAGPRLAKRGTSRGRGQSSS